LAGLFFCVSCEPSSGLSGCKGLVLFDFRCDVNRFPEEEPLLAPRPLITRSPEDIAYWSVFWTVDPIALDLTVRLYGPSITAVARAMDRPAGL